MKRLSGAAHLDQPLQDMLHEFEAAVAGVESVETFLAQKQLSDEGRSKLLPHLIQAEMRLAKAQGRVVSVDDFTRRFPQLDAELLNDLFLADTTAGPSATPPLLPKRYRLGKQVGEGGIATVWRVEDREMQRPLAAKVLREQFQSSRQANERLLREALLAGSLQHPGVPPVYEHGELLTGSNFFTMKLVEGKTLAAILAKSQVQAGDRQHLLGIFRTLCEAVGYAHAQGVIHRDLKPANVMVGAFGEVQIMDWGMAKQLGHTPSPPLAQEAEFARETCEQTQAVDTASASMDSSLVEDAEGLRLTRHGPVMGTPPYMSPEQARGEVQSMDARSDVFALGAMLFEILVGSRLYEERSAEDTLQAVAGWDLVASFQRLEAVEAEPELKALCRNCLAKKPDERPDNAKSVGNRLSAYMDGLAERLDQARLDAAAAQTRVEESNKRRKLLLVGGSALVVILLAATAVSSSLANRAQQAEKKARQESKLVSEMNDFLVGDLLGQLDPRIAPDPEVRLRTVLDRAAGNIQDRFVGMPTVEASLRFTIGDTYRALAQYDEAENQLRSARQLRSTTLGDAHPATLDADASLVNLLRLQGNLDGALELAETTWRRRAEVLGADARNTLQSRQDLAVVHEARGEYDQAEQLFTEVLGRQTEVLGRDNADRLSTMSNLAQLFSSQGRFEEAEQLLDEALQGLRDTLGEDHLETASCATNLAALYLQQGRYDEAETLFQSALATNRKRLGEMHPETLRLIQNLAALYQAQGKLEDAQAQFRECLQLSREKLGDRHPDTLSVIDNLATVLTLKGETTEPAELAAEAYEGRRSVLGEDHPQTIDSMIGLAAAYQRAEEFEKAEKLYLTALAAQLEMFGEGHINTHVTRNNLAMLYQWMRRYEESADQYRKALKASVAKLGDDHPNTLTAKYNLAELLKKTGDYPAAEPLYQELLKSARAQLGLEHVLVIAGSQRLAHLYLLSGQPEKAEPLLDELLATYQKQKESGQPPSPPGVAQALIQKASCLLGQARLEDAHESITACLEAIEADLGDHWMKYEALTVQGAILGEQGQVPEAKADLMRGWNGLVQRAAEITVARRSGCLEEAAKRVQAFYEAQAVPEKAQAWSEVVAQIQAGQTEFQPWVDEA